MQAPNGPAKDGAVLAPKLGMWPLITAALGAGLVGTPHCLGMCGGFALSQSASVWRSTAWQLGKLFTYATLGAVVGLLPRQLGAPTWLVSAITFGLLVWFALRLAGVHLGARLPGLEPMSRRFTHFTSRFARRTDIGSSFLFGALTGLLPCGLVYAALALAVAAGSPLQGALVMTAFGLGTVPALSLAGWGLRRVPWRTKRARVVMAVAVFALGTVSIAKRGALLPTAAAETADNGEPSCH